MSASNRESLEPQLSWDVTEEEVFESDPNHFKYDPNAGAVASSDSINGQHYDDSSSHSIYSEQDFGNVVNPGNLDIAQLKGVISNMNLNDDATRLLSYMCLALETAQQEKNEFEEKLRGTQSHRINDLEELNQEMEFSLNQEKCRLEKEFSERQEEMKELVQSEMSELQSKLDLLEAENAQLKFDLEEVDKERTELADEFRELERDNQYLTESLNLTKDELSISQDNAHKMRLEQVEEMQEKEKSLNDLVDRATQSREELLVQIEDLKREKERLMDEKDELESFNQYWSKAATSSSSQKTGSPTKHKFKPGGSTGNSTVNNRVLFTKFRSTDAINMLDDGETKPQGSCSILGLQEDEFWILDPRSSRHRSSTTSTSKDEDIFLQDGGASTPPPRPSCTNSTISLVSSNEIKDTVNKHIRDVESSTQLHSDGSKSKVFKVVFLGDASVGKTSFIQRFCSDTFDERLPATVGIDFLLKSMNVHNQTCTLQLWDTCGQEKFRALTRHYFRKSDGLVLMYDVTRPHTFYSLKKWMDDVQCYAPKDACLMVVGNKADMAPVDLETDLVKSTLGTNTDFSFTEVSSFNGTNVKQCMDQFTYRLIQRQEEQEFMASLSSQQKINVDISEEDPKPFKVTCCARLRKNAPPKGAQRF